MNEHLASTDRLDAVWKQYLKPPPKLTISQWADEHYYMATENSASPGKWKNWPFHVGILDAISDPEVEQVSVMKSARVGYTQCIGAAIGYYIHQDPCSIMVVQPTDGNAKVYSKEFIDPMIRATPVLNKIAFEDVEDKKNNMLHKMFKGGILALVGANSGAGFRMVSRRVVFNDEVDAYRNSAGIDGDQIELGKRRSEAFWNRKNVSGSTPLIAGISRIEALFNEGDQRHFYVPCPHCGHTDYLVFRENRKTGGHHMRWDRDDGSDAHFICSGCGCEILHEDKQDIVARGEWRASKPFTGHASFHIWAAYSFNINASWSKIAAEWIKIEKKKNNEARKTFINTILGEVWIERGEAPDWEKLYNRREPYKLGTIPDEVLFLTGGMDVQKNRVVYEIVGWGRGRRSWTIDTGFCMGDTSDLGPNGPWPKVREQIARVFTRKNGVLQRIAVVAIDSGAFTQAVYEFVRHQDPAQVLAVKGDDGAHRNILGAPRPADVDWEGKQITHALMRWPVGSDVAKGELYGWFRLKIEGGQEPPGYCHFSQDQDEEYFKQVTAEQLVPHRGKDGRITLKWERIPGRENHQLDCRVYARAAAAQVGVDRFTESDWKILEERAGVNAHLPPPDPPVPASDLAMIPDSDKKPWIPSRRVPWIKPR